MIAQLISDGTYQYIRLPKEVRFTGDTLDIEQTMLGLLIHTPTDNPNNLNPTVLATLAQNETELKQGNATTYTSYDEMMADLV